MHSTGSDSQAHPFGPFALAMGPGKTEDDLNLDDLDDGDEFDDEFDDDEDDDDEEFWDDAEEGFEDDLEDED
jgi:hypothetical protein